MKKFLVIVLSISLLFIMAAAAGGFWLMREYNRPGRFDTQRDIMVAPGTSGQALAQQLQEDGLIDHASLLYGAMRLNPVTIKAGEYAVPPHASTKDILEILRSGQVIQRQFTLTEGLTVKQAITLLNDNPYLSGTVDALPEEGTLLPETYQFTRGDARSMLIKRMQQAHAELLDKLWEGRDTSLPLASKTEAVTLASIVEKETGKPEERARIAGLFYNRLDIGMPLQTDPTVVYAITNGLGHMQGKPLLSRHLQIDSPYNTYQNVGLPPGPIANPGRASLEAVFKPEENDYLFFVADGTGGHVFARDLDSHNRNVAAWRKIKKRLNAVP